MNSMTLLGFLLLCGLIVYKLPVCIAHTFARYDAYSKMDAFVPRLLFTAFVLLIYFGKEYKGVLFTLSLIVLTMILVCIFVVDLELSLIPDRLLLYGIVPCLIIAYYHNGLLSGLIGIICAALPLALIIIITKGAMGAGDLKLMGLLAFALGYQNVLYFYIFSFALASLFGVVAMLLKKMNLKSKLPLGPFIIIGFYLCFVIH